jgi:16S rRNA processing protein RimM
LTNVATGDPLAELITIARIARPQGVRGEVIGDLLTDYPERFAERKHVWLGKTETSARLIELEKARFAQ